MFGFVSKQCRLSEGNAQAPNAGDIKISTSNYLARWTRVSCFFFYRHASKSDKPTTRPRLNNTHAQCVFFSKRSRDQTVDYSDPASRIPPFKCGHGDDVNIKAPIIMRHRDVNGSRSSRCRRCPHGCAE